MTPNREAIEALVDQVDRMIEQTAKLELDTAVYLFQMARLDLVMKASKISDAPPQPAKRKPPRQRSSPA